MKNIQMSVATTYPRVGRLRPANMNLQKILDTTSLSDSFNYVPSSSVAFSFLFTL